MREQIDGAIAKQGPGDLAALLRAATPGRWADPAI